MLITSIVILSLVYVLFIYYLVMVHIHVTKMSASTFVGVVMLYTLVYLILLGLLAYFFG